MFVLIWATLLFSVRSNADTGASVGLRQFCEKGYCITFSEGEITAEAGLCVVIPCLFTTAYGFILQHIVWYKCEPSKQRCGDSDIIFNTNRNNEVQSGFKGRVSLLEPDVTEGNCSIIINDLTEFDSGSYQLRVNGFLYGREVGYTFYTRAIVSVKGLTQRPTVMIPPLTEGQQTTLTCTAPGLCSGSDPEITWMWGGAGENVSRITGNITAFKTEDLTAVTQRHSSTLTFNPSAKHHGTNVTCKVSFTNNITTEEAVTLNVTYVKEVKITGNTSVKEGEALSLICSVESFPPALITWTKYSDEMQNKTETILQNDTVTDLQNNTVTDLQNDTVTDLQNDTETFQKKSGMGTFSILNVTTADSGLYICTAKHMNNTLMRKVNVRVIYMRKLVITGDTTVEKGGALNLTCSVESFPPSHVTWTVRGSNTNLQSGPYSDLQKDTGSATLFISDVTAEHSGRYICTAQHQGTTVTTYADITVTWFSEILETSGCVVQSEVLTCVCISEGFPLPTIKWPLLKNHTEYSVVTTVSNHTVNSTATVTVKDHSTSVECVSSNTNGEAKENLTIRNDMSDQDDQISERQNIVSWPEVIIAFVIGVVLSAVLCCLANKCHRKKQRSSGNLDETLEVVTSQEYPLIDAGQAVEDDQTYYQEAAEEGGAVAAEKAASDLNGGPKDVEYASIDFSVMKKRSPREAAQKQETTETEYAEVKKTVKKKTEENGKEEGEVLEGKKEQAMIEEDEESKQYVSEEEEGEEMAVYSSVKDVMDEICGDSDIIFHTNKNNKKVQSGFKGRVSLLEPDVTEGNCSIIVNDLTESDSGSYQLRVNGLLYGREVGYIFYTRARVSVKGLTQRPTVMIPPLTEGQQTTLTCTAPGLCSGSDPEITWMWGGAGGTDSHTTGNITAFKTEDLTAVTQRHSSTLTLNPSAKHHGTEVTCKVSFTNNITTEETVTLNVTYVKEVEITGNTSVKEGEALSLICSVESFPPALITWTKYSDEMQNKTETILQNDTVTDLQNDTVTDLQNDTVTFLRKSGMDTFSILNVTTADSGLYICTAKHLNNTLMRKVNVTVIYMRKLVITGDTTVEKGGALNLTCSVESFPPSHVTWTVRGSNTNLQNGADSDLQKDTGSATLFISDVTAEHSGRYICTAQHLDTTVTTYADITVTWFSEILETSGCVVQSEVLTCVCISEGFPLPTIKWPLLKNHTEYSVVTTVSNHMVNSTVTVTVKDHSTSVECVSSNTNGEAKENLTIRNDMSDQDGQTSEVLKIVSRPEVIIAFVIGVVLSAVPCCLAKKCHRKKQKSSGNLEVVTSQEYPLIEAGQTVEDDQTYYQEAAEEGGAVAAEKATSDLNGGPKDVEYASIDFSVMKRRSPREAAKKQETTETEYAEIKKAVKKETEENDKEEGEVLEGKEEQAMIEEDEETKQYVSEEEEGEEMAVYSSVKDVMDEM
ncbi:hypothetical protein ABVT39_024291 [Epinephelus coioides]